MKKIGIRWLELLIFVFFALLMALKAQAASTPVLLLMDSRAKSAFGTSLDEKMRRIQGSQVTTYGLCQSTPTAWLEGASSRCGYFRRDTSGATQDLPAGSAPALSTMLGELKPRYTVIVTGEASLRDSPKKIQKDFREIAKAIRRADSKCVWMGPVYDSVGGVDAYYDAIRELADDVECAVVDLPSLKEMNISFDLSDFAVELVKFGEQDLPRN